jgi:hypothetical protein
MNADFIFADDFGSAYEMTAVSDSKLQIRQPGQGCCTSLERSAYTTLTVCYQTRHVPRTALLAVLLLQTCASYRNNIHHIALVQGSGCKRTLHLLESWTATGR